MTTPPPDLPPRSPEWQQLDNGFLALPADAQRVGVAIAPGPEQDRIAREIDWYARRRLGLPEPTGEPTHQELPV